MTREEFQTVYDQGPDATFALFQEMQQTLAALSSRLNELEARLSKDSHNSGKPPSSDGLGRPAPRSLRQKSGRRPGGQPGHPGTTLCLAEQPDEVVTHGPPTCAGCGACLEGVAPAGGERRQVHDLPPLSLRVTEHRALRKACPFCHTLTTAPFPAEVTKPVQYGPGVRALCVYLQQYQLLPFARTQELLADLLGCPLSEGTLFNSLAACHERLSPVEAAIKEAVGQAPVGHFDETGVRIQKGLHWLHTAGTASLTFLAPHAKRGKEAMDALGVLPAFSGTAVHDAFASYFGYECSHALCNAHLLRDLVFITEQGQVKGQTPQPWAEKMSALLLLIKVAVETAHAQGQSHLSSAALTAFEAQYQALVAEGLATNPARAPSGRRGRTKQTPARNLLERLDTQREAILAFMSHFAVPFDNNQAERDLRMAKVRQKVSGCFRSAEGVAMFCRIRGYIATLRKQGLPILTALQSVFAGQTIMPNLLAE
jgi:transposase